MDHKSIRDMRLAGEALAPIARSWGVEGPPEQSKRAPPLDLLGRARTMRKRGSLATAGGEQGVELLEIVKGPGPRSLALVGELDASNAHHLADALAAQHEERGDVRLDLSRLIFLDSVGLSALIATAKRLIDGDQLVLLSPQGTVRRALELSGVAWALPNLVVQDN